MRALNSGQLLSLFWPSHLLLKSFHALSGLLTTDKVTAGNVVSEPVKKRASREANEKRPF